ncbi:hypothetical protein A3L12_04260 [Thermococcus sp. P6]|uniref:hypothetical protein n=1 Tax=Thermococcus sp. P6 TaxID=122420 RepID=UPI000B59E936|nr:hypothetical protein [Thermococcus sp. P6]ASJ10564.1 hypothetical protein A3L12_04260 [Thermococcus sp. P6]
MKTRRLLLLNFRTTLKESAMVFVVMAALLFYGLSSFSAGFPDLISRDLVQVYFLTLMMITGYTVTVSLYFASFLRRKTSRFYHLYLILPEEPHHLFLLEMLPALTMSLLLMWAVGLGLYGKLPSAPASWLLLPMVGSGLFTLGFGLLSSALMLQVSNVRALSAVLFLLIFVLVRIPRYIIQAAVKGELPLDLTTAILTATSFILALVGFLALKRVDPERVLLSS